MAIATKYNKHHDNIRLGYPAEWWHSLIDIDRLDRKKGDPLESESSSVLWFSKESPKQINHAKEASEPSSGINRSYQ